MKRALSLVMGVGMVLCTASAASASPIANWAALNALLGGFAVTENFEAFAVASGTGAFVGGVLDATSTPGGQGPGLIVPNLQVSTSFGDLFWQGAGFFSLPTQTMGAQPARDLTFDFLGAMAAFGMDLLNYGGFPATYQVTVYGSDDATILSVSTVSFPSAVTPTFFGFEFAGGIGRVRVDALQGFGPVADNVTFGAVPEPASMTLLASGLAGLAARGWRKRAQGKRSQGGGGRLG
jgi:PEP-CTERM motif